MSFRYPLWAIPRLISIVSVLKTNILVRCLLYKQQNAHRLHLISSVLLQTLREDNRKTPDMRSYTVACLDEHMILATSCNRSVQSLRAYNRPTSIQAQRTAAVIITVMDEGMDDVDEFLKQASQQQLLQLETAQHSSDTDDVRSVQSLSACNRPTSVQAQ